MSRFLAPLCLALSLFTACVGSMDIDLGSTPPVESEPTATTPTPPVDIEDICAGIDNDSDGSYVYPLGCSERPPLDCDDTDPSLRAEEGCYHGNADLMLPDACMVGIFSIIVYSDPGIISFPDGREFEIHAVGWIEVVWEEDDPIVFSMTDLDGDVLTFEEVVAIANVFPVTETDGGGFQTGSSLEPVEDDPPWVAWNCP